MLQGSAICSSAYCCMLLLLLVSGYVFYTNSSKLPLHLLLYELGARNRTRTVTMALNLASNLPLRSCGRVATIIYIKSTTPNFAIAPQSLKHQSSVIFVRQAEIVTKTSCHCGCGRHHQCQSTSSIAIFRLLYLRHGSPALR